MALTDSGRCETVKGQIARGESLAIPLIEYTFRLAILVYIANRFSKGCGKIDAWGTRYEERRLRSVGIRHRTILSTKATRNWEKTEAPSGESRWSRCTTAKLRIRLVTGERAQ